MAFSIQEIEMRMQKMLCSLLANNTVLGTVYEERKQQQQNMSLTQKLNKLDKKKKRKRKKTRQKKNCSKAAFL